MTACLVLAALMASPVLAAPAYDTLCENTHSATLEVAQNELTAAPVSHDVEQDSPADKVDVLSADHLLKPSVEAIVREAFADTDDEEDVSETSHTEAEDPVMMNTRVPGVSDDELARFKRQLLRKDI